MMNKAHQPTREMLAKFRDPNGIIVDVRPMAAFNGWKLQDELRGGHIPGAIPFPLSWLEPLSGDEQRSLLTAKGIIADKKVIIYGYGREDCETMVRVLQGLGFQEVTTYEPGLAAWAAGPSLPLEHLSNYRLLVHAAWLYQLVSGRRPEAGPEGEWLLFEVAWQGGQVYESGHIPGAHYLETTTLENEPLWNRVDDATLEVLLPTLGIRRDQTILLYGRDPMAAARVALILMDAGVSDVRLLDGGYAAWTRAGYPVESGINPPRPTGRFGQAGRHAFPGYPEYIVDTAGVKASLVDEASVLVSVRSWTEFTGQVSGYSFIQTKGRIPGAVWGQAGSDPQQMEAYRNRDNTMRNYQEIASFWRGAGITPDKRVIFSCGTGWRAAEAFFCAHLMDWPQIAVYDGGWLEWSLSGSNPIEVGEPR